MSSKQTLLCCEGLALSVQCGFEVVGCPEHKSFSRRCLDCCARETSQISPCREGEAGRHSLGMLLREHHGFLVLPPRLTFSSIFTNLWFFWFFFGFVTKL